jgi:hypothetical protein
VEVSGLPDPSELPPCLREIVEEHYARKAVERAVAERQATAAAWREREEAITAHRRATAAAPLLGHMANATGRFVLREPRRLTAIVSTEEQRHIAAVRQRQAEDARNPVANIHPLPTSSDNNAPVPRCNLRPPAFWDLRPPDSRRSTDLSAAMP